MKKTTCLLVLICAIFFVELSAQDIQRIYLNFETNTGFQRQLLLGFTPDNVATDGYDYGYDGGTFNDYADDFGWIIEGNSYVIQGVGEFNTNKYYPIGMFLTNSVDVTVSLAELNNFEEDIDVYLYDVELDSYTLLNASNFTQTLQADNYIDRFYITFSTTAHLEINNNLLSVEDNEVASVNIWYSKSNNELYVSGIFNSAGALLSLYSLEGKKIIEEKISKEEHTLNTSEISNGIYIVIIDSDTFSQSRKVCIAN
ncbi:T9SS type A sorting domain-containing protein [Winogradskyella sp.]